MEAAKKVILRLDADIDALQPITPAELAASFPVLELRQQFIDGALVISLAGRRAGARDGGHDRGVRRGARRRHACAHRPAPPSPSITCWCSRSTSCGAARSPAS
jgi:hypothetical protein